MGTVAVAGGSALALPLHTAAPTFSSTGTDTVEPGVIRALTRRSSLIVESRSMNPCTQIFVENQMPTLMLGMNGPGSTSYPMQYDSCGIGTHCLPNRSL